MTRDPFSFRQGRREGCAAGGTACERVFPQPLKPALPSCRRPIGTPCNTKNCLLSRHA